MMGGMKSHHGGNEFASWGKCNLVGGKLGSTNALSLGFGLQNNDRDGVQGRACMD